MSNRRKLRVPGRYQRPAALRAPLGDTAGEAGIRDGYRAAAAVNAVNAAARRRTPAAGGPVRSVEVDGVDISPYVDLSPADVLADPLAHRRQRPLPADLPPPPAVPPAALVATVESATATAERVELHEAAGGGVREEKAGHPGTYVIDVIRSGWNTSGSRYYAAEVLERDVPRVYGRGTQMYIDHPRASDDHEQPERSLTTLAAVFLEDPWPVREDDGSVTMRTTARVFGPWQPLVAEAWPYIGVSINGQGQGDHGEREGKYGLIVEELTYGRSVDFVTRPGAGGRVVGLMESAHAAAASPAGRALVLREAGTLGAYVESRIHLGFTQLADDLYGEGRVTREERITLSGAIGDALAAYVARIDTDAPQLYQRSRWDRPDGAEPAGTEEAAAVRTREASAEEQRRALDTALQDAYGGQGRYCWARDYDPDRGVVWFDASVPDGPGAVWQQSYRRDGGRVELLGDRIEVRPRTVYDPVRPDGQTATTETTAGGPPADDSTGAPPDITTRENDMGTTNPPGVGTREADLTRERDAALDKLARYQAADTARPIIDRLLEASTLPSPAHARVRADFPAGKLPLVESAAGRVLDETQLRTLVEASIAAETAYVAQLSEAAGAGRVTGMGAPAGAGTGVPSGAGLPGLFGAREADAPDPGTTAALVAIYESRGFDPAAAKVAAAGRP